LRRLGPAIQLAGDVKARGERRRVRSDWMAVERERGISVSSAMMSFEHQGLAFNLLDTPGHQDFSEDTYRTLTAVDSAVMVLDAAPMAPRGIEEQTRKLFEVCRPRDVPIITFVNKLDHEARDPFDLIDEIEQSLALDVTPASWPIGMGQQSQNQKPPIPAGSGSGMRGTNPDHTRKGLDRTLVARAPQAKNRVERQVETECSMERHVNCYRNSGREPGVNDEGWAGV